MLRYFDRMTLNVKNQFPISYRIFIQDGCSPVGCVLTQLTKKWGAYVTSSCHIRSVPVIKALGKQNFKSILK